MFCYQDDCGEFAVTPMLAPCLQSKCDPPSCNSCLPRCPKTKPVYCCERPVKHECCEKRSPLKHEYCEKQTPMKHCCERSTRQCDTNPCCRPVKTKYVMPCYRYEDGRIQNQPTLLMRRACEVAVGVRQRRKTIVKTTADPCKVEHQYYTEDEKGNCCFHFERKKPRCVTSSHHDCDSGLPCRPIECSPCELIPQYSISQCESYPQCEYVDCVQAQVIDPNYPCCKYC